MQDLQEIIDLEKLRFENDRMTQQELGDLLGVSKQQISSIEKGKSKLTSKNLQKLRDAGLITLQSQINDDCSTVPVRGDVYASMGSGITVYNENQTATYQISNKLASDIGVNLKNTEMIFASGDSMEPTIMGGDSLLVDKSKTEIYDGRIYCVRIDGQLYAKRLQKLPPNKVKVVSDNEQKYDPFYVDFSKDINFDFAIIGEIRWWGRVAR